MPERTNRETELLKENAAFKLQIKELESRLYRIQSEKQAVYTSALDLKKLNESPANTALLTEDFNDLSIKKEESFRALTENSIDVIMRFDRQFRHLYVNPVVEKFTGIKASDMIGKTHEELGFPEELVRTFNDAISRVFKTASPFRIEFQLPNKIWIDWLLVPEFLNDGSVGSVITTAREITERKQAEEEIKRLNVELEVIVAERTAELKLRNSELQEKVRELHEARKILAEKEKRYRLLFDHSPSGIMVLDSSGTIIDVNPAACTANSYRREELLGKNIRMIAHPDQAQKIDENITALLSGMVLRHVVKNIKKDNATSYMELNETKFPISENEEGILSVSSDITKRVLAEKKLKANEERLRSLINAMPDIVCFKDDKGRWLEANQADLRLFCLENVDYIGKTDCELAEYSPFFREAFLACEQSDEHAWEKKNISAGEELITTPDGAEHLLEIIKVPLFHSNGERKGLVVLGRDITERKKAELELIKAKEDAEKSNKLKSEFLAQMSHEIRSPINIILSFTSLLKEEVKGKLPQELDICFDSIDSGGKRIIRTIDQILNMSEIQTGSFESTVTEIDLINDILSNCITEFKTPARLKGLELKFKADVDNSLIKGDSYSINQIFINLIDNAIKYTHYGEVEVVLSKPDAKSICVDVRDTGIGISEEYLPDLFKPFSQEESGYTRRFEGNGLGLALVKKYAEINNAEIIVDSAKGSGSLFRVVFKSLTE